MFIRGNLHDHIKTQKLLPKSPELSFRTPKTHLSMGGDITNFLNAPKTPTPTPEDRVQDQQQALTPDGISGSNDPFADEFKSVSRSRSASQSRILLKTSNNVTPLVNSDGLRMKVGTLNLQNGQLTTNEAIVQEIDSDEANLRELHAMKPNLKELMSGKMMTSSKGNHGGSRGSSKKGKSSNSTNFRKNMFSLSEDIKIMNCIRTKGTKSERQVFRDLVVEMNRSDEALKTRYKSYLKPLNQVDKMLMRNKAKELNPVNHCAII